MTLIDINVNQIQTLLHKAQLSTQILGLACCSQGGNNRTYRVQTTDGIFAVKKYFRHADDKRDRLAAEFAFLNFATNVAPNFVPKPYSQDNGDGIALYEYIEGKPVIAEDVDKNALDQALEFFCALNATKMRANATSLPFASEAAFSIQDHLRLVGQRVQELKQSQGVEYSEGCALIKRLLKCWQWVSADCLKKARKNAFDIKQSLVREERCISPSDFGFHNALLRANHCFCFIDFEYGGWDDPARMVNDFFSQLAIPIPDNYYDWFLDKSLSPFKQHAVHRQRALLLKSVYGIKWCCIALNIFLPTHLARRQFANPDLDIDALISRQIEKAHLLLTKLETSYYGLY